MSTSKGDQSAFTQLLKIYWNKVYTQALTYLKSAELAQEVTQDVFVKLWSIRQKLVEVDSFSNYLFILSRNAVITVLRKKKDELLHPPDDVEELVMQPDKQLHFKETYDRILNLIDQLPPVRKKVFRMSRLEGKSYEEIGAELGISRNGVKDHIVKALNFLRSQYGSGLVWLLMSLSSLLIQ